MRGQFLRTLGSFGGDDDPFLGEKILAELGHVNPSSFFYRQNRKISAGHFLMLISERMPGREESASLNCYRIPSIP
jgi:hypothetical protein